MFKKFLFTIFLLSLNVIYAENQTSTLSPVLSASSIPFTINISVCDWQLPNGWHSGISCTSPGKAVLFAGRTNGVHGFDPDPEVNNFPPTAQNSMVYVVDFASKQVWQKSLYDSSSGLTQTQIDSLTVTSPQCYQSARTLYISGGYGTDTPTSQMGTKSTFSVMDIPSLISWVMDTEGKAILSRSLRQTTHPLVQVTGGWMYQLEPHHPVLLIFGQNFEEFYRGHLSGTYTQQVRSFRFFDNGKQTYIAPSSPQAMSDSSYRRRDLNVVPIMLGGNSIPTPAYVALSGVFTQHGGLWTVPILISPEGTSFMSNPEDSETFKQAMNNYACANAGLFSKNSGEMYILLFGGITYGYFDGGNFQTDAELPFTNQVTTIKINKQKSFSQHLMDQGYPTILSTFSNPGNTLLFGTGAEFIANDTLDAYRNGVFNFDNLPNMPVVIGHIIGGIQSSLPNTNSPSDSAASPYIFQVTLTRR